MMGIATQVGQVLLLREMLMVFHGNELSIGLILAAWLIWVGVGSRLGAWIVVKIQKPLVLLLKSAAALVVILPATILLIRFLRAFYDLPPGAHLSLNDIALSSFLVMAPVCLLLGVQFVFLSRVWRKSDREAGTSGIDKTYVGEAGGNMLGGLLFTFILVHYLNPFQSAFLVGLLMLGAAIFAFHHKSLMETDTTAPKTNKVSGPRHKEGFGKIHPVFWVLLVLAVIIFPFLDNIDDWAYRLQWQHFTPEHELSEMHHSEHGTISVVQRHDQYSFFQSGHLVFSTAGPETFAPGLEEQEAVELAHLAMSQHQKPQKILLIGGGLRGVLGEITRYPAVEKIDYIELDETLTSAALPHVSTTTREALKDPRVNLIHTDGRMFVKTAEKKYDLIMVDIPDPATAVLNRYYTQEFFAEARELLNPDGVLVSGATSTPDLRGTAVANRNTTIYHTLNDVFKRVLPAGERFMTFIASDKPEQITLEISTLQKRFRESDVEGEEFSPYHFQALLEEGQLRRVNWVVRSHGRTDDAHLKGPALDRIFLDPIPEQEKTEQQLPSVEENFFINTDFQPIGYYYTLMLWDELTRPDQTHMLQNLLHVRWWWILPLCIFPLLIVARLRMQNFKLEKRTPPKKPPQSRIPDENTSDSATKTPKQQSDTNFAVLFTVFTTGFSTMAMQIALLFSFQSIYGFIYEMVGLIMALFMCGLSLGAFLTHRYITPKSNLNLLAAMQLVIAMLALLIAVLLNWAAGVPSPAIIFALFSSLTFTAGLINGIDFPLSAACYMSLQGQAEKTAGTVYGLELVGACIGAALASVVVAPILGILACCVLAAIVNFTAFVVLLICRKEGGFKYA